MCIYVHAVVCMEVHMVVENKVNLKVGAVCLLLETFSHWDLGLYKQTRLVS